jgi:proline iminopeptidase
MRTTAKAGWLAALLGSLACASAPRTTELDSAVPAVRLGGYAFHAETFGSPQKPPLIVVHGGPGGDYASLLSLKALADEYHVLFYDQRGSGLSPREEHPDPSIEAFVRDLDQWVDRHGSGSQVRLIGHSWGAMIVTAYLARHGEKVSHAVLAEPGILHPESAKAMMTALKASQTLWRKLAVVPLIVRYPFITSEDGQERMDYIVTKMMGASGGPPYQCDGEKLPPGSVVRAGYRIMNATVIPLLDDPGGFKDDYTRGLQAYTGKTLFLSSRCSFIGYDFQERYHLPRFPSGTLHRVVEGTGHNMFTLRPAESLEAIRPFLRG